MTELLRLNLLGTPQSLIGDRSLTGAAANKTEALLFYLAVTADTDATRDTSHSREALATLLWREQTDTAGQAEFAYRAV